MDHEFDVESLRRRLEGHDPGDGQMWIGSIPPTLVAAVLARLQVETAAPDFAQLGRLIGAYIRTVPWESAFRIVKRDQNQKLEDCPRWPVEFWIDHLERGGGGTCFESNYAFFALLRSQGFTGYLTVNNMGDSVGCHSAIIVTLDDQKWIVDAGFPLYGPLPLAPGQVCAAETPFMTYKVRSLGADQYRIERFPHPETYAFTLIDRPVEEHAYREATTADYLPDGHFLNRVIIHKVIAKQVWRFNSAELPYCLQRFHLGERTDIILEEALAAHLAAKFDMNQKILGRALALIGIDPAII